VRKQRTAHIVYLHLKNIGEPVAAEVFKNLPSGQRCGARFIAENLRDLNFTKESIRDFLKMIGYTDDDSILVTLKNEGLI